MHWIGVHPLKNITSEKWKTLTSSSELLHRTARGGKKKKKESRNNRRARETGDLVKKQPDAFSEKAGVGQQTRPAFVDLARPPNILLFEAYPDGADCWSGET